MPIELLPEKSMLISGVAMGKSAVSLGGPPGFQFLLVFQFPLPCSPVHVAIACPYAGATKPSATIQIPTGHNGQWVLSDNGTHHRLDAGFPSFKCGSLPPAFGLTAAEVLPTGRNSAEVLMTHERQPALVSPSPPR